MTNIISPTPWSYFLDEDKFIIMDANNEYVASSYAVRSDDGGYIEQNNIKLMVDLVNKNNIS